MTTGNKCVGVFGEEGCGVGGIKKISKTMQRVSFRRQM